MVYPEGKQSFQRGRMALCGISTVVVRLLPKQEARVRFSYPAHFFAIKVASKRFANNKSEEELFKNRAQLPLPVKIVL